MKNNFVTYDTCTQNIKAKFKNWCTERDPLMWIAADFECRNVPVESKNARYANCRQSPHGILLGSLFVSKPVATGIKIVKKNPITTT